MAELLIKAIDATHTDPGKDFRGCYKRGDIVQVRPDGFAWGRLELLPPADGGKFVVLKITGATPSQVRNAIRNRWGIDPDSEDEDQAIGPVRRRRIRIDADLLPASVRQTLNQTGQYTTTWAAIRQYVRNKQNNETATGATL